MPLKTRLDKRSAGNSYLEIVTTDTGEVIATIAAASHKVELNIETKPNLFIRKPNGFTSKK